MKWINVVCFSLIFLPACGETKAKQVQFGRPKADFEMALGISRQFDFLEGETGTEILGDAVVTTPVVGETSKPISVVLTAIKPGEVAIKFLKGKAGTQIFKVTVFDGLEKTASSIKEQLAFEKNNGIPVASQTLAVGKCLAVSSPVQKAIGAINLTQPNVASADRINQRVNVCALKAGFTDVTVWDEQGTVITHLFLHVASP